MDTNALAIFVDVVRKRSFAAVARDRNVDATTISRTIAALEHELTVRLFHRTTRAIQPTEAGMVYFERIEPLVDELIRARLIAAEIQERPQGVLRVACPVSFAELNVIPLVPEFAAQYPELTFEFLLTDAPLDLITEHLDVAIRVGPLRDSTMISHKLCPMIARVCATPGYLQAHGRPATPADLATHGCLVLALPGFSRSNWKFTNNAGQTQEVRINELLRTSNAMALKQWALASMGITLQARWMVGRELRDGTLIDVFPEYAVTAAFDDAAAWLLYPSRTYVPQKVRVFVDFLRRQFKDGPPWDT
ncbi:MAG: LysR family transcriptional regulator [Roseiflexaceae bacterium]|nr:LysR family transcriptional regulator [Roseiflexaceae bacterium]